MKDFNLSLKCALMLMKTIGFHIINREQVRKLSTFNDLEGEIVSTLCNL